MDTGGGWESDAHLAGCILLNGLIHQPLFEELLHVHKISCRTRIDHGVACPGIALSSGTIHRHIQKVALLAPAGILHQFVDQLVRAAEAAGLLHVGVDGDRLEVRIF